MGEGVAWFIGELLARFGVGLDSEEWGDLIIALGLMITVCSIAYLNR